MKKYILRHTKEDILFGKILEKINELPYDYVEKYNLNHRMYSKVYVLMEKAVKEHVATKVSDALPLLNAALAKVLKDKKFLRSKRSKEIYEKIKRW